MDLTGNTDFVDTELDLELFNLMPRELNPFDSIFLILRLGVPKARSDSSQVCAGKP